MPHTTTLKEPAVALLRAEVEMLMNERQSLLKTVGAAAVFIANLDSGALPEGAYESAEMLSNSLNDLPEDSLRDALSIVKAEMAESE